MQAETFKIAFVVQMKDEEIMSSFPMVQLCNHKVPDMLDILLEY